MTKTFFAAASMLALTLAAPTLAKAADAPVIALSVDATQTGAKIDRHIFGQFAEHLGTGVYGGIWVGRDSPIPNTRGIRNDVVAALKAIKVPDVRWPGGCYADNYHWRGRHRPQAQCPRQHQLGRSHRQQRLRHRGIHGFPRPDWRRRLCLG
ncbi:MAG: hypothetical protein WDN06_19895 [Asticcacaulis sp.]